jgi:hypothetical protein
MRAGVARSIDGHEPFGRNSFNYWSGSVSMKGFKEPSPNDRQRATRERKHAALEKFVKHGADPALSQRLADRATRSAERATAREVVTAQRAQKSEREAEAARNLARESEEAAKQASEEAARNLKAQRDTELAEATQRKAGRDARYAARKARQKRGNKPAASATRPK